MTEFDSSDWRFIVKRIREGECVLFLGAGANVKSEEYDYPGLPLGGAVAFRIMEMWMDLKGVDLKQSTRVVTHKKITDASPRYDDLTRVGLENLARVALHVESREDFKDLFGYLKDILPDEECIPSPLLDTIARIPSPQKRTYPPFQLIVTTNYDSLLEKALDIHKRDYKVIVQRPEGFDEKTQKQLENELAEYSGIVVYKIHGSFTTSRLNVDQILNWSSFCLKLKEEGTKTLPSPSRRVLELLPSELRQLVVSLERVGDLSRSDKFNLVAALNDILKDRNFYRKEDFEAISANESKAFLGRSLEKLTSAEVQRLNRLLLQAAYPNEIKRQLASDHPIIVTEDDYIQFLTVIGKQGIPTFITSALTTSTLLFLGYSLEDWDFRTVYKALIEGLERREQLKSYAIQRYPSGFWVDFWKGQNKKVHIRDVDVYDFAEDLKLLLNIEEQPFLKALCTELEEDAYDLIVARRLLERQREKAGAARPRLSWSAFARLRLEHASALHLDAVENAGQLNQVKSWLDFLRIHHLPQDEPRLELDDTYIEGERG